MPTALIAAGIGAAGSIIGGNAAADAARESARVQAQIRAQNAANLNPWITGGQNSLNLYNNATGANGRGAQQDYYNNFQTDPGYNNVLQAGTNAISNSAAARGTLYGGNTLRDINDYGGNLLQGAYNTRMSQLNNGSTLGVNAASALAGSSTSSGVAQGNALAQAGQYQGNSIIGGANALIGGINSYNNRNTYAGGYSSNGTPTNLGSNYNPSWSNTYTSNAASF